MIDDKSIAEFLRRSYFAADGLWFVAVEEGFSYEDALRLDEKVWEILPRIQARKARELLGIEGDSLADLERGLALKFEAEGYVTRAVESSPDRLEIAVTECPWFAIMKKAGRESRAGEICDRICTRDFAGWAARFSEEFRLSIEGKLPDGETACVLVFGR